MTDRVPGAPGQYIMTVAASEAQKILTGEAVTVTLTRDDQPLVEGTPYNKASVLPDDLAERICPNVTDPNPADALSGLNKKINNNSYRYNYLDNSNFTQFIAQAGIGGAHGTQAYAGDRWILDSGTVTGEANENGNGYSNITLNGTIRQIVANPPDVGTVVIEMVSGTAEASYVDGEVIITSAGGVIKNVALYEGTYTTENKSKYQPKGYGAELAECQRYFLKIVVANICGIGAADRAVLGYYLPVPMRGKDEISPTVTVTSTLWVYTPSGAVKGTFSHASANANMLLITVNCTLSGNTVAVVPDFTAYISKDL